MPTDEQQNIQPKRKKKFFTLLTFVLLICIIELTVGTIRNANKSIHFHSKIKGLEEKKNEELIKNKQLKSEIENFNSATNLESIARNNLKMAGENEILIIINKPTEKQLKEVDVDNKKNKKKK